MSPKPSAANETVSEQKAMRAPDYWKGHYLTSTDPAEIALALRHAALNADDKRPELIYFLHTLDAPNFRYRKAPASMPTSSPSWHIERTSGVSRFSSCPRRAVEL